MGTFASESPSVLDAFPGNRKRGLSLGVPPPLRLWPGAFLVSVATGGSLGRGPRRLFPAIEVLTGLSTLSGLLFTTDPGLAGRGLGSWLGGMGPTRAAG